MDIKFLYSINSANGNSKSTAQPPPPTSVAAKSGSKSSNTKNNVLVAILSQDLKEKRHVKIYEADLSTKDLNFDSPLCEVLDVDPGSNILVPLPPPLGGCVVIGMMTIMYIGSTAEVKTIQIDQTTRFNCVGMIDRNRFILSDHVGMMYLLQLLDDSGSGSSKSSKSGTQLINMKLERLGVTSAASTLSYLDNGVVFVGSVGGDSQLVELSKEPVLSVDDGNNAGLGSNGYVKILESWSNLGPIVDLAVVDLERQGQGQVRERKILDRIVFREMTTTVIAMVHSLCDVLSNRFRIINFLCTF